MVERAPQRLPTGPRIVHHHLVILAMTQLLTDEGVVKQVPLNQLVMTRPLVVGNTVEWVPQHLPIGLTDHHLVMMVISQLLLHGDVAKQAPRALHLSIGVVHPLFMMATTQPRSVDRNTAKQALQALLHHPTGLRVTPHLQRLHHRIRSASKHPKFAPEFFSVASLRHRTMMMLSSAVFSKQCLSMKHISLLITHTLRKSCSVSG